MNALLLGANSDIGRELAVRLHVDGWTVFAWARGMRLDLLPPWSLLVCAIGTLRPVGEFFATPWDEWRAGVESNALEPLRLFHALAARREEPAAACFFGGTNPYRANPRYSSYAAGKALLRMAVRDIGAENHDLRIFMLDSGIVATKIHVEPLTRDPTTTHDMIYAALKKCLAAPINKVRGNYFYVPEIA